MLSTELPSPRPTLTNPDLLASLVDRLGASAGSPADVWRLLTERYAVDLDAVAAIIPRSEPEPRWLPARG